ncbi:MAG: hypothetical protein AAF515_03240 [Pseudomonadota bacterium]
MATGLAVYAAGAEFGLIYACACLAFAAWAWAAREAQWGRRYGRNAPRRVERRSATATSQVQPPGESGDDPDSASAPTAGLIAVGRHLGLFLTLFVLAGTASILITILATQTLDWAFINRMALVTLLMPTLWGGLMFWTLYDFRRAWPTLVILWLVGAAGLFLV